MLVYHPAFDPYHSVFRMMRILEVLQQKKMQFDGMRIADFYVTFPALIARMTLPRELVKWKRCFSKLDNPYHFSGEPKVVFRRMETFQTMALSAMASRKIIAQHQLEEGIVVRTDIAYPNRLEDILKKANEREGDLMRFLSELLAKIPVYGSGGLKARTGLLEYRYDAL